jgi:hypothetical protein
MTMGNLEKVVYILDELADESLHCQDSLKERELSVAYFGFMYAWATATKRDILRKTEAGQPYLDDWLFAAATSVGALARHVHQMERVIDIPEEILVD